MAAAQDQQDQFVDGSRNVEPSKDAVGSRTLMSTLQIEVNEFCFFESIQAVDERVSANFRRKAVAVGVNAHG